MSFVYVKLPKVGLGNLLLIWANAKVFALKYKLPIFISSWGYISFGPWIRSENRKRFYGFYFKNSSLLKRFEFFYLQLLYPKITVNKHLLLLPREQKAKSIYEFNLTVLGDDLFGNLRDHRDFLKRELIELINPSVFKKITNYPIPVIGIHIRRGDFKLGNPLTPIHFFVNAIIKIRMTYNSVFPVTIFTDANIDEIEEILSLPNVTIASKKPDILDILLFSKSKILILSQSSTFSYWAAFLSENIIIRPCGDWQKYLRSKFDFNEIMCDENNLQFLSSELLRRIPYGSFVTE